MGENLITPYNSAIYKTIKITLNLLIHVTIANVLVLFWKFADLDKIEASERLHIKLCTVGYQFCMTQGILVLSKFNCWSLYIKRRYRSRLHVALQMIAIILVIAGSTVIMVEMPNHFETPHGTLGLCALILTLLSLLNGICTSCSYRMGYYTSVIVKVLHFLTSMAALYLATLSLFYKVWTEEFSNYVGGEINMWVLVLFIVLFTLLATVDAWHSMTMKCYKL